MNSSPGHEIGLSVQGEKMGESTGGIDIRLAEAASEVYAARLIMQNDCQEILARAKQDNMPTLADRARYRRDQSYMTKLCVQAVNRIFESSGGRALYDSSPIQRFHRDLVHAASHHFALSWDTAADQQYSWVEESSGR